MLKKEHKGSDLYLDSFFLVEESDLGKAILVANIKLLMVTKRWLMLKKEQAGSDLYLDLGKKVMLVTNIKS